MWRERYTREDPRNLKVHVHIVTDEYTFFCINHREVDSGCVNHFW